MKGQGTPKPAQGSDFEFSRYAMEMPKKQEMETFLKQLGREIDHEG